MSEVRVTASTGASKGSKPQRHDLIPVGPLSLLAEHYGKGAAKYAPVNGVDNWRNGLPFHLNYAAMQRHLIEFWSGKDVDEETGSYHLIAAAWHCFTLVQFMLDIQAGRLPAELDDRQEKILAARGEQA